MKHSEPATNGEHATTVTKNRFVRGREIEADALAAFLKKWLDPQLPDRMKVGIDKRNFKGVSNYLREMPKVLESYIRERRADVVFGLVDLYGLPGQIDLSGCDDVAQKVVKARNQFYRLVKPELRAHFRQHFAVHETEAWLLAYPEKWPEKIRAKIEKKQPEQINFNEPPSKFLRKNITGYKKTVDARNIFRSIDPKVAYRKCPYLKNLMDDLLQAAKLLLLQ